jgi:hypothetical protein
VFRAQALRPDFEQDYLSKLYDKCRQGKQVEGAQAVTFLKLSGLSNDDLKNVWNLSSVHK